MKIDLTPGGLKKGNIFALKLKNNEIINTRNLIRDGRVSEAVIPMISALLAEPKNPDTYQNFSDFFEINGEIETAISIAKASVKLHPKNPKMNIILAEKYIRNNQTREAIECCKAAIKINGRSGHAWAVLGEIYWITGRVKESFECFQEVVFTENSRQKLIISTVERFYHLVEPSEMRIFLKHAVSRFPMARVLQSCFAESTLRDGRPGEALQLAKEIENFAQEPILVCVIARALIDLGRPAEVLRLLSGDCNIMGQEINIDSLRAVSLRLTGQVVAAKRVYEKIITAGISDASVYMGYARCLNILGLNDECLKALDRALDVSGSESGLLLEKAECLSLLGRKTEAVTCLNAASSAWTNPTSSLDGPSLVNSEFEETVDWANVETILKNNTLCRNERLNVMFALGHHLDAKERYREAMSLWSSANQEIRASYEFNAPKFITWMKHIPDVFSAQGLEVLTDQEPGPFRPIFIVGMPRTGTSLAEHILSSHSNVRGGGESLFISKLIEEAMSCFPSESYPEFLAKFDNDDFLAMRAKFFSFWGFGNLREQFVVDKLPGNFLHIGLMQKIFPEAIFIECVRDQDDTALSIFGHWFREGHPYAYDLREIYLVQDAYHEVMDSWRSMLDRKKIQMLKYEELVRSPISIIKKLLVECDLSFEENCLAPYKKLRAVENSNARRLEFPIDNSRVGRSHNYGFGSPSN